MTEHASHPTDDDLVLLFYGEVPENEAERLRSHLDACADCRTTWNALTRTLHLAGTYQPADPGPDFERRMWSGLAPDLRAARRLSSVWWSAGTWAAALLFVVAGGWLWTTGRSVETPPASHAVEQLDGGSRERVLLAAVDAHLVQTEMLFVELMNAPGDEVDALDYVRTAADDLVASGRLYRETARDTGASQLVAVLDELEPVLVEVARSGPDADTGDIRALRGRIEQDDLLFKVRAVAADIQDQQGRPLAGEGAL